jgi:hypothetical protein
MDHSLYKSGTEVNSGIHGLLNTMAVSSESCFSREPVADENLDLRLGLGVFRPPDLPSVILQLQPGATLAQIKLAGKCFLFYTLNGGAPGIA